MDDTACEATSRGGALWRNRDFLLLWGGETVSLFGTQVTVLALPLTAILVLHSSAGEVGGLRLVQLLPYLLFSLVLGVVADGRPRRGLMVLSNGARVVLIGLVPVLALAGALSLPALYLLTFAAGTAAVLFDVSWMAYVPALIRDPRDLPEANGKLGASASSADVVGPGLAGLLIGLVTAPYALVVDAGSYLVSLASLLLIRGQEAAPTAGRERRHLGAEIGEGLRWVLGNPVLRVLAFLGGAYNFSLTYIETVFLVYAVREVGMTTSELGVILSAGAVGGLLGATAAARVIRWAGVGRTYLVSVAVAFSAWLLIPAATGPRAALMAFFVLALFLGSVGIGVANVVVVTLRQTVTPRRLMGRMSSVMRMLMFGLAGLGGPVGGLLAGVLGLRPTLWVGAVAAVAALVPLLRSGIGRMRELPPPADGGSDDETRARSVRTEEAVGERSTVGAGPSSGKEAVVRDDRRRAAATDSP